ncbi:MAG: bifunctional (p)ppGpp synthetase/guanosine-3',5'-bis(diphosphate) 3'-pyrophosphohydrolase [Cyanobacteria bacterium Co-bin13]|nr:bifunctional (p)ppGpp synthetase/guanosine-3',5'-bis(diphosphate) 3'-pyrophosphohydrolase [Cyanobacteria bacterium Co-bin13]
MNTEAVGHLLEALVFAADKHRDQRRKDQQATPYINHPIGLVSILWHEADIYEPIVLMAALLHDTVEDTDTQFVDLQERFGKDVEQIVRQVTDDKSLPKAVRKQLQIDHAAKISDAAKLVKLADKIYNLRDMVNSPPAGWSLERQREYCEWAKRVVDQMRGVHPRLEALFDDAYAAAVARDLT